MPIFTIEVYVTSLILNGFATSGTNEHNYKLFPMIMRPTFGRGKWRAMVAIMTFGIVIHICGHTTAIRACLVLARARPAVVPIHSTNRTGHRHRIDMLIKLGITSLQCTHFDRWGASSQMLEQFGTHNRLPAALLPTF